MGWGGGGRRGGKEVGGGADAQAGEPFEMMSAAYAMRLGLLAASNHVNQAGRDLDLGQPTNEPGMGGAWGGGSARRRPNPVFEDDSD